MWDPFPVLRLDGLGVTQDCFSHSCCEHLPPKFPVDSPVGSHSTDRVLFPTRYRPIPPVYPHGLLNGWTFPPHRSPIPSPPPHPTPWDCCPHTAPSTPHLPPATQVVTPLARTVPTFPSTPAPLPMPHFTAIPRVVPQPAPPHHHTFYCWCILPAHHHNTLPFPTTFFNPGSKFGLILPSHSSGSHLHLPHTRLHTRTPTHLVPYLLVCQFGPVPPPATWALPTTTHAARPLLPVYQTPRFMSSTGYYLTPHTRSLPPHAVAQMVMSQCSTLLWVAPPVRPRTPYSHPTIPTPHPYAFLLDSPMLHTPTPPQDGHTDSPLIPYLPPCPHTRVYLNTPRLTIRQFCLPHIYLVSAHTWACCSCLPWLRGTDTRLARHTPHPICPTHHGSSPVPRRHARTTCAGLPHTPHTGFTPPPHTLPTHTGSAPHDWTDPSPQVPPGPGPHHTLSPSHVPAPVG